MASIVEVRAIQNQVCRSCFNYLVLLPVLSDRAQKVLDDLTDLIDKAAGNQSDLCFARSATSILRLYVVRAQPEQHCGVDAGI